MRPAGGLEVGEEPVDRRHQAGHERHHHPPVVGHHAGHPQHLGRCQPRPSFGRPTEDGRSPGRQRSALAQTLANSGFPPQSFPTVPGPRAAGDAARPDASLPRSGVPMTGATCLGHGRLAALAGGSGPPRGAGGRPACGSSPAPADRTSQRVRPPPPAAVAALPRAGTAARARRVVALPGAAPPSSAAPSRSRSTTATRPAARSSLAVTRAPALDAADPTGTLLFNPGGPGESGNQILPVAPRPASRRPSASTSTS